MQRNAHFKFKICHKIERYGNNLEKNCYGTARYRRDSGVFTKEPD